MNFKKSMISIAAASILAVGFTGCGDSDDVVNDTNEATLINTPKGTVTGLVQDTNGNPLNGVKVYLADKGVGTLIQWGGQAVHEFRDLGFTQSLPYTESIMRMILLLPMNMSITNDEIDYICQRIREFYD